MASSTSDEQQVRALVENWAAAVRRHDMEAILAKHTDDFVMFDVPPPFQSKGLNAYRKTWDLFYPWAKDLGVFDIIDMTVVAGSDVAFCFATMHCAGYDRQGKREDLDFRLTVGLKKINGQWMIAHEHHSVPSTD